MFERLHFVAFSPVTQCLWQFGLIGFSSGGVQTGQGKGVTRPQATSSVPMKQLIIGLGLGWLKSHHVGQGQKYHCHLQN